ncbi:NACHT and WD repeat domain-containing protein 2-like [Bufo bufo]|uniref:NACHT and WD repeat domain-containing protein 2-like n=1 Tax=Bufo bufo TaxID=8384 RepID=UPI001ABE0FC2|nr:NACHT and WD repeat domain-containing protein 2-like [Bufo bufo]
MITAEGPGPGHRDRDSMEYDEAEDQAILCGDIDHIPTTREREVVKVFLCAEPVDSMKARAALSTKVYPKLREYCRHVHGLEFQVIDGYHGIHPGDFYSSKIRQIRMRLLEECLRTSAGPCFVALLGEEYGQSCLPAEIECEEFEKILHIAEEHEVCTRVLQTWYLLDENAIPPAYTLLYKGEELKWDLGQMTDNRDLVYAASQEIRQILRMIVPLCVQRGILGEVQAQKYVTSALEDELLFALQNGPVRDLERSICYIHKVPFKSIQKHREKAETSERGPSEGYSRLCHLRDVFIPAMSYTEGLQVYSTITTCDIKVGYTEEKEQVYAEGLCRQFYGDMVKMIDRCARRCPGPLRNGSEDVLNHLSLCTMYSDLQEHEFREEDSIRTYILYDKSRKLLVVSGEPGCGKTLLLASCGKKVRLWLGDRDPTVVIRFVPSFGELLTLSSLIMGLCEQLANIYQIHTPAYIDDIVMLVEYLSDLLSVSSKQRPLILILDGVENLKHCCNPELFWWLPPSLPQFTRIILSVTENTHTNQNQCSHGDQVLYLHMKPTRKECNDHLKMKLLNNQRKITSGQQVYVNRSLGSHTSPLQMLLLFKVVKEWKSHQDLDSQPLGENAYQSIENFLQKLERKYGDEFISRMLSYITLSRSGIGEVELIDVLSADDMALTQLYHVHDNVGMLRAPDWLIANILHDLKDCIAYRVVTGYRLLWWTNGLYQQVVSQRYLQSQEVIHKLHASMCDYFWGRWANRRAKSISISQANNLQPKEKHLKSFSSIVNRLNKIYVDRQLPSQPWSFNYQFMANIRKATDLPYHLKESGKLDNLYKDILMVLPYYKTLLSTGHINLLIRTVEEAAAIMERKEIYLIYAMLKELSCLLNDNPNGFNMIIQSNVVPLVFLYPCLLRFARQIFSEAMKNSFLIILNSAQIKLPPTKVEFQVSSNVVTILEMAARSQLLVVLQDGRIYTWSRREKTALVYQQPKDMEVITATLDNKGLHLAFSTTQKSIVLLDCSSWTFLIEICGTDEEAKLTFYHYLSQSMLFVCFKNSPVFSIYDIHSGDLQKEVTFSQNITYFACVGSGDNIVIGQTAEIFILDVNFLSEKITLQMDTSEIGIRDVYIHQSDVYIIDVMGHLRIWSIADPSKPELLDEHYSDEVYTEVISTEFSSKYLLICKLTTLDVWEMLTLKKSSFRPPHKDKFSSCVLSKSGEQVFAVLKNVPSLLVWSIKSGQCISVIDIPSGEVTQLTKSLQLNLLRAITRSNSILLWDLEAIASPTAYSKTGRPVRSIILCSAEGNAYTSDGSDVVCQWNVPSSKIKALFRHRNPVENICVTSHGEFLITSTISELYVWETDTGINRHCIQCNLVSQLLIVPNSNFVVTLCKDGISRVWKPKSGTTVCKICTPLNQAIITDERTFVVGLNDNRLLAISLWSGSVSREFSSTHDQDSIVAFQCVRSNPDFIVLLTSSAEIYTWNIVEETFCHFSTVSIPLPILGCFFEVSSDGDILIITLGGEVNVVRTAAHKHCVLHNPTTILYQHLTSNGQYLIYVLHNDPMNQCDCDFHENPTLNVIEVVNGRQVAHCHLGKMPCAMTVSDDDGMVCIGFEDGTLGLYSIAGKWKGNTRIETFLSFSNKEESSEEATVNIYEGKMSAEILWNKSTDSSVDCSGDEEAPSDIE